MILPKKMLQDSFAKQVDLFREELSRSNLTLWIAIAGIQGRTKGYGSDRSTFNADYKSQIKHVFPPPFYIPIMKYPLRGTRQVTNQVENERIIQVNEVCSSLVDWEIPYNMLAGPDTTVIEKPYSEDGLVEGMRGI